MDGIISYLVFKVKVLAILMHLIKYIILNFIKVGGKFKNIINVNLTMYFINIHIKINANYYFIKHFSPIISNNMIHYFQYNLLHLITEENLPNLIFHLI